jgi:hypothetical protein
MGNMCNERPHDKNIKTHRKKEINSDYSILLDNLGEYEDN